MAPISQTVFAAVTWTSVALVLAVLVYLARLLVTDARAGPDHRS